MAMIGVEVVTPERNLFTGAAVSLVTKTSEGDLTVMAEHAELIGLNCLMNQIGIFPFLVLWKLPSQVRCSELHSKNFPEGAVLESFIFVWTVLC